MPVWKSFLSSMIPITCVSGEKKKQYGKSKRSVLSSDSDGMKWIVEA